MLKISPMTLLFKTGTPENDNKTTVGDSNFCTHYSQLNKNTDWETIQPFIRQATRLYVVKWIGQEMYDKVATLYDSGSPNAVQSEFIERLQDAVAWYTMYLAMPQLNVVTGDMGVGQNRDTQGTFDRTSQWAYKQAMWSIIQQADQFLDKALEYADEQVAEANTWFDEYADSTAWTQKYPYFRSTASLQEHIDIRDSRRAYLSMVKYSGTAFDKNLLAILGKEQHDELVEQIRGESLTEENQSLLEKVQKSLAYYTLAEALPHMRVVLDGDGVKVVSSTDFYDRTSEATDEMIVDLRAKSLENARMYRAELNKFLYENVEDYPTWAASDRYITDSNRSSIITSDDRTGAIIL